MKEVTSNYDDTEKRLGIFVGLGAFLLSSVFGIFQGLSPESFLVRGVTALVLFSLLGWAFGAWLKRTLIATAPEEELPANMERRSRNAESLDEGGLVQLPQLPETEVPAEPGSPGQAINFTLPELDPAALVSAPTVDEAPAAAPAAAK